MTFTEQGYRDILATAIKHYRFEPFGVPAPDPHVLWRHDIDISPQRAARMAAIETEAGVRATYFVHLHSRFYNALEPPVRDVLRTIAHPIGLHFEAAFYAIRTGRDLERHLAAERAILERLLGVKVRVFSFHNPTDEPDRFGNGSYAGMTNASGREIRARYDYVSDSNGFWRYRALGDVLESGAPRLHVLTHPEWWTPAQRSPRERVARAIEGRARATGRDYDAMVTR